MTDSILNIIDYFQVSNLQFFLINYTKWGQYSLFIYHFRPLEYTFISTITPQKYTNNINFSISPAYRFPLFFQTLVSAVEDEIRSSRNIQLKLNTHDSYLLASIPSWAPNPSSNSPFHSPLADTLYSGHLVYSGQKYFLEQRKMLFIVHK